MAVVEVDADLNNILNICTFYIGLRFQIYFFSQFHMISIKYSNWQLICRKALIHLLSLLQKNPYDCKINITVIVVNFSNEEMSEIT